MPTPSTLRLLSLYLAALVLPCLAQDIATTPVPWPPPRLPADSPFAEKTADSYASYSLDGKRVHPIWGSIQPEDFGPRDADLRFDFSGIRPVNQVPAPGVHPRVLCTPADLPDIRRRLKETRAGQEAWKNLLCYSNLLRGDYDQNADYAQSPNPVINNGGVRSRVPLTRVGAQSSNTVARARYQALIKGDLAQEPGGFWNVFPLEAFRCWIEGDAPRARDLAAALTTALKIEQAKREAKRKDKDAPLEQPVAGIQLAYTYDFLHGFMTAEQRRAAHAELANGTWSHDNYGAFNEATTSRSNWATFSYWLVQVLAIEGEPGFNDLKVRGSYRGWRNLMTYGWFPSGATFEAEGKNQLGMDGVLAFAMRSQAYGFENLAGHPHLRAYAREFLPKSLNPARDGFIKYDLLGGARARPPLHDLVGLKYLFPDDKIVDWAYRYAVGNNYENVPNRAESGVYEPSLGGGYLNPLLYFLIFATDYDPKNGDPAKFNLSNTFFCGERALMMTRSGWDKEALMLNLHVRQASAGHPFADRNSIMVAGAGRVWSPIAGWGAEADKNINNSVVVIDDQPQANFIAARLVDFKDEPLATFAVGDAKYAWDWSWKSLDPRGRGGIYTTDDVRNNRVRLDGGYELDPHSVNEFSFIKRDYAYLNAPLGEQPSWNLVKGALRPVGRKPNYPVQRAFRTAGLVRGAHPYALVVDDIQKDDTARDYTWYLTLEHDLQIASITRRSEREMDILLTGDDPTQIKLPAKDQPPLLARRDPAAAIPAGQPMLLVRFLDHRHDPSAPLKTEAKEPTILETLLPEKAKGTRIRRLAVPVHAVSPEFKVLIYAYRQGQPLPESRWSGDSVNVNIDSQRDRIDFTPTKVGKTDVRVVRGSDTLISVDKVIAPLAETR